MNYTIAWLDATMQEHYKSEEDFVAKHAKRGITVEIEGDEDDWWDYSAYHKFQSKNDDDAKSYAQEWLDKYDRNVDVFSLVRNDNGTKETIMTEDDR